MRGLHWFRNDLRLRDNRALEALFETVDQWAAVFVVEPRLVDGRRSAPKRSAFLFNCLDRLGDELGERGIPLVILEGRAEAEIERLMHRLSVSVLSFNEGATPFSRRRDSAVRKAVERHGHRVIERRDHVIFGSEQIRTAKGDAYAVYSPYRKAWWKRFGEVDCQPVPSFYCPPAIEGLSSNARPEKREPNVSDGGPFVSEAGETAASRRLDCFIETAVEHYERDRDRPDLDGTSRLSPHLRFGTISPRECFSRALAASRDRPSLENGVRKWLDEMIWREFYNAILEEHPRVLGENYRTQYDLLPWRNDPQEFEMWCQGRTGYPIVDAGMRQLREVGWMHNRVRMIVASFLTKDLLIDWRYGENFFMKHLVDGDPASNNGGWQWAASTGTDSQPFFRIFNPKNQAQRWDPEGRYIRQWLPELRNVPDSHIHDSPASSPLASDYPEPMVDHAARRAQALELYRNVRTKSVEGASQ